MIKTRKSKVTLSDADHAVDGYLFVDTYNRFGQKGRERALVAFDADATKKILSDMGCSYEFSKTKNDRGEKTKVLTYSLPGSKNTVLVEGIRGNVSGGFSDDNLFPLEFDGVEWKVIVDGKPTDVLGIAKTCADDLVSHIKTVLDSYESVLGSVNERDIMLQCVGYHLGGDEHGCRCDLVDEMEDRSKRLTEEGDGFVFCSGCGEFVPVSEFSEDKREETKTEVVHVDAGWGDDDIFGDVTRLNTYRTCGRCGHEKRIDSRHLCTTNRRGRSRA